MGIKTKDHSDFMNELNLRMILWSTAEAVLRQLSLGIYIIILILWSTAEAVLRQNLLNPCDIIIRSYGLLRKRY